MALPRPARTNEMVCHLPLRSMYYDVAGKESPHSSLDAVYHEVRLLEAKRRG